MADPTPVIKTFKVQNTADIPDGLVANWTFANNNGNDNISPKAKLVAVVNVLFDVIPGTTIRAAKFAGTAKSFAYAFNTDKLNLTKSVGTSFTVESWIYATGAGMNPGGYGGEIVNKDSEFEYCRMGDGRIAVAVDWGIGTDKSSLPGGGWIIPPAGTAVVPLNTAAHVAIVVDNTTLQIVINGNLAWEKTGLERKARIDKTNWYIGNRTAANQGFNGYIGDVRVWNRARSVEEIAADMHKSYYQSVGSYSLAMGFTGECTAYAWGGGGGAGGSDASSTGGNGAAGLYNSTTFTFNKGDVIEVSVGEGGYGGNSGGAAPGGPGGRSRINLAGKAFNGGSGSPSGPTPYSGAGGGGGGATVVTKNNSVVLVAAGGGGGAGAGNDGGRNKLAIAQRADATAFNNMTGVDGSKYNGAVGQTKSGDGGGGGGGGGGYPGGLGGAISSGDTTGYAGKTGGNYPGNISYYDVTLLYASMNSGKWSTFMQQHSGWPLKTEDKGTFEAYRTFNAPATGSYTFKFAADNSGELWINGTKLGNAAAFNQNPAVFVASYNKGSHRIRLVGTNAGGPAGWALTIEDSAGQVIWDLRDHLDLTQSPAGRDNRYYESPASLGGIGSSGDGRDGMAVLVFTPKADIITNKLYPSAVKVGGNWKQIIGAWVKVNGTWREITDTYVKQNGVWKEVKSTTQVINNTPNITNALNFTGNSANYGASIRNYGT